MGNRVTADSTEHQEWNIDFFYKQVMVLFSSFVPGPGERMKTLFYRRFITDSYNITAKNVLGCTVGKHIEYILVIIQCQFRQWLRHYVTSPNQNYLNIMDTLNNISKLYKVIVWNEI